MRRIERIVLLAILLPWISLTLPALASNADVDDADAKLIRGVIEKQLDALKRDDWLEAFSYAAPFIQRKFGSPDTFRRMVMGGYSIVHRPRMVSFKGLEEQSGRLAQNVLMVGPNGRSAMVVYFMEKMDDGAWRIAGVSIVPLADLGA
jgi:hypothetical protein